MVSAAPCGDGSGGSVPCEWFRFAPQPLGSQAYSLRYAPIIVGRLLRSATALGSDRGVEGRDRHPRIGCGQFHVLHRTAAPGDGGGKTAQGHPAHVHDTGNLHGDIHETRMPGRRAATARLVTVVLSPHNVLVN